MGLKTTPSGRARGLCVAIAFCLTLTTGLCWALVPKDSDDLKAGTGLSDKEFFLPELYIPSSQRHVDEVLTDLPNSRAWENFQAGREQAGKGRMHAFVDPRSGTATNMLDAEPLIPGKGVGNRVTLAELSSRFGYKVSKVGPPEVADAVLDFVSRHRELFGVDMNQLGEVRATRISDELWNVNIPQTYHGIPVRGGRLAATLNHGNLVLIGTEKWGNIRGLSHAPRLDAEEALEIGFAYADGQSPVDEIVLRPSLEIVPVARDDGNGAGIGQGYGHRLVWGFQFRRPPAGATWEVLVDAHDGEVISFRDVNDYATISGGVYPVTSTEICPTAGTCGIMQSDWPMPWADTGLASPNNYTNSGGVFTGSGSTTTTLSGLYVDITDYCGTVSNTGSPSIDLGGVNGDHDCTTGGGSAGNTAASRTAFYEVNKLMEIARGWLPSNTWLQSPLTTRVNMNNTCNAYYSSNTINFYRSGGGCRNTGELAGVFDHEWGHGLDYHDTNGTISSPGEAYADIAEIYRIQHSCVGHGFFWTLDDGCGMTADGTGYNANEAQVGGLHCDLDCSGVRDADWDKHADHNPDTPLNWNCVSCSSGTGPCGAQVHCAAAPARQAAWDFVVRDLQAAPFNLDNQTAFIIGNKVFYQGSGNVGNWFTCTCGSSSNGCGATNGYMLWLAADDDDGSISNGTPHMTALYNAFNRHEIACTTPTPTNSGCAAGPTGTATLSSTPGNNQVSLSWTAVASASKYWVFRTEGHAGCDYSKALIAETTGLVYTDTEVANGREYYYNVVAVGTSDSCFAPVSNCATVTPVGMPDFSVSCTPANHTIQQGANATSTCTVTSVYGFSGTVDLSCSGEPAGISCAFVPSSVTPPVDGSADSTLTLTVDLGQATGTYNFDVEGTSSATTRTSPMSVLVTPEGTNGPQDAVFNATYQAPACLLPGSECDSLALLDGRDGVGPEPNQPNTIYDSCADGTSGTYHNDESNDRIVVKTLDGNDFYEGATVEIDATVWAWSTGSSDYLDLYYAADATSPSWVFITTINTPAGGAQTLSATYTLPEGGLQAVRANFRYVGSASSCSTGSYDDHDDLVFAVNTGGGCTSDPECDDGLYCNGAETCDVGSGTCQAGTAPDCDDGISCTDDSCNESTDSCDNVPNDALCDNGLFCDGAETCDQALGCQAGTAPDCDDGVGCTDDSCNESTDACDNVANDANCDNGLFCDGAETCDAILDCQAGSDPCPGQGCDEEGDVCTCLVNDDCDDGVFCNGAEICNAGVCEAGTPINCDDGVACTDDSCNESTDACDNVANDANCDNGLWCDGAETCNATLGCQAGTAPNCDDGVGCTDDSCNDTTDACDNVTNDANCDNGLFCDGAETCDAVLDCQAGSDPCPGPGQGCDEEGDVCTCVPTEDPEVSCSDGIDNDCDGLIDGDDPDCAQPCKGTFELCDSNDECCSGFCFFGWICL